MGNERRLTLMEKIVRKLSKNFGQNNIVNQPRKIKSQGKRKKSMIFFNVSEVFLSKQARNLVNKNCKNNGSKSSSSNIYDRRRSSGNVFSNPTSLEKIENTESSILYEIISKYSSENNRNGEKR